MTHINKLGSLEKRGEGHVDGDANKPIIPIGYEGPGTPFSNDAELDLRRDIILGGAAAKEDDANRLERIEAEINLEGIGGYKDHPDGWQRKWNPETSAYDIKTEFANANLPLQTQGVGDTYDNLSTGTKWQRDMDGVWVDTGVPIQNASGGARSAADAEQAAADLNFVNARTDQIKADIIIAEQNATAYALQGEEDLELRERIRIDNLNDALAKNLIRRAELISANTRFELGLELDSQALNQKENQFVRELSELARQFDLSTVEGQRQFDNSLRQREAEFVRQAAIDVAQFNAQLSQGEQQFNVNIQERGREFDVQATQQAKQFAAQLGLNYDELASTVGDANANRMLSLAVAQGDLDAQRALLQFNSAESAKDRTLALANMQAVDERSRQQQIQSVARDLADFAQQPGDQNALLAFQAALGGPDAITRALGGGGSAITDTSLQPGAIQLSLLEALNQPSTFLQAVQASIQSESGVEGVELGVSPEDLLNNAPVGEAPASLADVALGEAPAPTSTAPIDPLIGLPSPRFTESAILTPNAIGTAETFVTPEASANGPLNGACIPGTTGVVNGKTWTCNSVGSVIFDPVEVEPTDPEVPNGDDDPVTTEMTDAEIERMMALTRWYEERGWTYHWEDATATKMIDTGTGLFIEDPDGPRVPVTPRVEEPAALTPSGDNGSGGSPASDGSDSIVVQAVGLDDGEDDVIGYTGPGQQIYPPDVIGYTGPGQQIQGLAHGGVTQNNQAIANANVPRIDALDQHLELRQIQGLAHGGVTQNNQAIVGDAQTPGVPNPELVTDIPGPGFAVQPLEQTSIAQTAAQTSGPLQPVQPNAPYFAPPPVSHGPVADLTLAAAPAPTAPTAIPTNQPIDPLAGIRGFLTNIVDQLLASNPLFGQVPTPVNVAAPGTSLEAIESAAGLAATGRGIPTGAFKRERNRLAPRGVRQGIISRSR